MARKRYPPDDPREWLNRARSNLALAQSALAGVLLEDLCFEAPQAAEKAIKAVFVGRGETFPYTHDLERILRLLHANGVRIPKYVEQGKDLTPYGLVTRYPGVLPPVTARLHRRAVRIATSIVGWAKRQISRSNRDRVN